MPSKKLKPGIYDMPAEQYHADCCPTPSLSSSVAKILVSRSPMHAWFAHPRLNSSYAHGESEAFDIGTVAHDALLQGVNRIEVVHADSWRTNAAKEQRGAARAKGLIPLLEKNFDRVAVMVQIAKEAIANCDDLSGITLDDGKPEQTLVWRDVGIDGGTWCRARLDWLANDHSLILDYKTTSGSAEPNDVIRTHAITNGWDLQAAFYLRGQSACRRVKERVSQAPKFVFLAQEIEPPYACSFIGMPPAFLAFGFQKVNAAVALWAKCLHENKWPAYPLRICWPEVPPWAEARYLERTSTSGALLIDEKQLMEGIQP